MKIITKWNISGKKKLNYLIKDISIMDLGIDKKKILIAAIIFIVLVLLIFFVSGGNTCILILPVMFIVYLLFVYADDTKKMIGSAEKSAAKYNYVFPQWYLKNLGGKWKEQYKIFRCSNSQLFKVYMFNQNNSFAILNFLTDDICANFNMSIPYGFVSASFIFLAIHRFKGDKRFTKILKVLNALKKEIEEKNLDFVFCNDIEVYILHSWEYNKNYIIPKILNNEFYFEEVKKNYLEYYNQIKQHNKEVIIKIKKLIDSGCQAIFLQNNGKQHTNSVLVLPKLKQIVLLESMNYQIKNSYKNDYLKNRATKIKILFGKELQDYEVKHFFDRKSTTFPQSITNDSFCQTWSPFLAYFYYLNIGKDFNKVLYNLYSDLIKDGKSLGNKIFEEIKKFLFLIYKVFKLEYYVPTIYGNIDYVIGKQNDKCKYIINETLESTHIYPIIKKNIRKKINKFFDLKDKFEGIEKKIFDVEDNYEAINVGKYKKEKEIRYLEQLEHKVKKYEKKKEKLKKKYNNLWQSINNDVEKYNNEYYFKMMKVHYKKMFTKYYPKRKYTGNNVDQIFRLIGVKQINN
jgi:hypothetical protein